MPAPQPPHPLHALTTSELNRYRRDLEQALRGLTGHDPERQEAQQRLAEVHAEQQSRTEITTAAGPPHP